jgi:hypothetical protein
MSKALKISFDYDSTISEEPMQKLAKKFLDLGAEVFIVTSRATEMHSGIKLNNDDVFEVANALGIKRENIIFTSYKDKYSFVKNMDMHFDDDMHEIFLINQHPSKCIGFLYESKPDNGIANF